MVALIASAIADFWLGGFDWVFLLLEGPALLLLTVGSPLFGLGTLRARVAPPLGAWLLATGAFPGIFLLILATGHLSGGLLMLDLAWVVLGYALWQRRSAAAGAQADAGPDR